VTNFSAGPLFISDPASFLLLPRSLGGNLRFGCEVIFFSGPAPTFWSRGLFCSSLFLVPPGRTSLHFRTPQVFFCCPVALGATFVSDAGSTSSLVLLLLSGHGVGFVVFCSSWQDLSSFRTPQVFFCCPVALGATFVSAAGSTALLRSCSYWHLRLGSFLGKIAWIVVS